MKILVTGGAGFIGSHLVDRFLDDYSIEDEITVVDDLSGGYENNVSQKVFLLNADCRDEKRMDKIFKEFKPKVVYHLAANAAENKAQFSPIDITSRNYSAFINTLTPFIKYGGKHFIFTSSVAVYGGIQTPFREKDRPEPEDLYGITKLAAEQTLKVMSKVHGFKYTIARPHNVYGPRQNMSDPYRNVVTIWMNAILQGKPYYIYGNGEQRRCFSYIDDVVDALVKCQDVTGIFNIGADRNYSLNDLSQALLKVTGSSIQPVYLSDRPQEVKEAIPDHTEAKKVLRYDDRTSLEEGLKRTWEWAKKQGYQEPKYTDFEIDSPLIPKNWRKHD